MKPRHHVIISGTGRAGTTFLVQLCTALGVDTGFKSPLEDVDPRCDAGMETHLLVADDAPYVVKSPHLCIELAELLRAGTVVIDHALVPVRDLRGAAESRRDVHRRNGGVVEVPGGLWGTSDPDAQEGVLARHFYELLHVLALHEIPTTLLSFPRLVRDPDYLWRRLRGVFQISEDEFAIAYAATARPELVHDFGNAD